MKSLRTYVINLDASTERLQTITAQLDKYALKFERVSAVDGRRYDLATLPDYDDKRAKNYMGRSLVGGEIGCYYSHLKVAKVFLESDASYALVLEDDAIPLCDINALLKPAIADLDRLDPEWLLMNIGNNKMKISTKIAPYTASGKTYDLVAAHYFPMTTSAIVWSRKGAERFLKEHNKIFAPVDNYFRHWLTRAGHSYSFWPAPVTTSEAQSLILASEGKSRSTNRRKWYYGYSKQKRLIIDKVIAWRAQKRFNLISPSKSENYAP